MKIRLAAAAVVLIAGLAALPARGADQDPRAVAASVAIRDQVQQRLPSEGADEQTAPQTQPSEVAPPDTAQGPAIDPKIPLIVIAAVIALWLIALLWHTARSARRGAGATRPEEAGGAITMASAVPANGDALTTADAFAAAGRYTDAIHELLAGAIARLAPRHTTIPPAATSRELLHTLTLPAAQERALDDMISRVERTWFAERPALAGDFAAVRAHFQTFITPGATAR